MLRTNAGFAILAVVGMLWKEPWGTRVVSAAADNIRDLITAAHGVPAAVCDLAADAVGGWNGAGIDALVGNSKQTRGGFRCCIGQSCSPERCWR